MTMPAIHAHSMPRRARAALVTALLLTLPLGMATACPNPPTTTALRLTPATVRTQPGAPLTFTAVGVGNDGNATGDLTSKAAFSIVSDGSCASNTCAAASDGGRRSVRLGPGSWHRRESALAVRQPAAGPGPIGGRG